MILRTPRQPSSLVLVLAVAACSGGESSESTSGTAATGDPAVDVILNELSAVGAVEWIELANKGTAAVELGGYALTDTDKSTKRPKLTAKMLFPEGTRLDPQGHLLVLMGKDGLTPGPYTAEQCIPAAGVPCFYATFSISAADGESLFLVNADNAVVLSTAYPSTLGIDATSNRTACRSPDLVGELVSCAPSPGAANASP